MKATASSFSPANVPSGVCPGCGPRPLSRRGLLKASATGFGWLALSALFQDRAFGAAPPSPLPGPHFAPRAKSVIFLFMDGGVSQVDSFDYKPELAKRDGQLCGRGGNKLWKSPWEFAQRGRSGLWVSDLFPHLAGCADDLTVIRSMTSGLPIHATGNILLHTGHNLAGRPSLGSWVNYGLGAENRNLPGYALMSFGQLPSGGMEVFSSGFLPATYEPTILRAEGAPIENLTPADAPPIQQAKLELLGAQDSEFAAKVGGNKAIEAAIRNYEMAARMQTLVPDVLDESKESKAMRDLYGLDDPDHLTRLYARQCLRARRLVEAGVRFIQINCPPGRGSGTWDQHDALKRDHEKNAHQTDRAIAGLIHDLKQRGLLDETLIVWSGEFGRTPYSPKPDGRDHQPEGFTVLLAGGGAKGGFVYGATNEIGSAAVENVCDIHDLHATILHLLGLDHERLTYRYAGRDFRLTDVKGRVIKDLVA